jgi:hypothetical protein
MTKYQKSWLTRRQNINLKGFKRLFITAIILASIISLVSPEILNSAISQDIGLKQNLLPLNGSRTPSIPEQITAIAQSRHFAYTSYLLRLSYCESRFDTKAVNDNGIYGKDHGAFQINLKYHPNITIDQAEDITFATNWTIDQINAGRQNLWACDKYVKGNFNYIAKQ